MRSRPVVRCRVSVMVRVRVHFDILIAFINLSISIIMNAKVFPTNPKPLESLPNIDTIKATSGR